ncbi:uncharacterized protein LOC135962549 [Calliphora vicina]|uniref:uncharacterized protein LOC135962549 n=1 Tax=Calliphora vicina TaxID=7373 RepID=UPI00325B2260
METTAAATYDFEKKTSKIYFLTTIFILSSVIQWCLLINLESFEFLINPWLLLGGYIAFMLIVTVVLVVDCTGKSLPSGLEWLFGILLVEILVIALSITVDYADHIVLYISLAVILICLVLLFVIGAKINLDHLPIFVLAVFSANMLLILLIFALIIIAKLFTKLYTMAFFAVTAIAYPILIMNTLYVSMLLKHDRYEIKTLTDCLKPALYIYGIFGAFVWFSISLGIVINDML